MADARQKEAQRQYARTRQDRLEQLRTKLALVDSLIDSAESEAVTFYRGLLAPEGDVIVDGSEWDQYDRDYANTLADLRSAKEALRVLLAHGTSALSQKPLIHLFTSEVNKHES